jgi:hypothetical protein
MRDRILYDVMRFGKVEIDIESLNSIFPEPKKPTIDDMETAITSIIASPSIENRGEIAHVFQSSQREQIEKFTNDNGLKYYENYANRTMIFGLKAE